jgi:hypothetical protein
MNASTDNGGTWKRGGSRANDLEREGDQLRAEMDRTLDEIERELSPQKLLDRSMDFFREHGSDFVREAGDTIRRNPLPVLLTAAGIVWLTASVANSRSPSQQHRQRQRWSDDGTHLDEDDGAHLDEDMGSFDEYAAGHGYGETSTHAGSASRWKEKSRHLQHRLHERSRQVRSEMSSQLGGLVREQPLALGALALAAGALLGAALPMTSYENRVMGPARGGSTWRDRGSDRRNAGQHRDEDRGFASAAGSSATDTTMIDE